MNQFEQQLLFQLKKISDALERIADNTQKDTRLLQKVVDDGRIKK